MIELFLLGAPMAPVSWFLWAVLHELAHVIQAGAYRNLVSVRYRLYPHVGPHGFRFASVEWDHYGLPLRGRQAAWVALAPRRFDAIGIVLAPVGFVLFPTWAAVMLAVLFGGSLVDLFVGSLGISPDSDLRVAAFNLGISPWWLRLASWGLFAFGIWVLWLGVCHGV